MKKCSKCLEEKPLISFCKGSDKDGRHRWCKACVGQARMKNYHENLEDSRRKNNQRNILVKDRNCKLLCEYLSINPCVDCGETDPIVLQFDHINPDLKRDDVSHMLRSGYAWKSILAEIEKCRVVCSNCHLKRTAMQFNWRKIGYR